MSRKRVDAVRRAFDEWAGLTPEKQRELTAMIAGYQMRDKDGGASNEIERQAKPSAKMLIRKLPKKAPAPAQADHHHGNAEVS